MPSSSTKSERASFFLFPPIATPQAHKRFRNYLLNKLYRVTTDLRVNDRAQDCVPSGVKLGVDYRRFA